MAAWAAIIILTAESDNLATGLAQQLQSVAWISQAAAVISTSIVPATVTIINAIMPIIIKVCAPNNGRKFCSEGSAHVYYHQGENLGYHPPGLLLEREGRGRPPPPPPPNPEEKTT